jgi:serine phosphatase RsbU (regulator of sigma subunit)/putative methionine-R-sulfoxide reductase with GAF domain
MNHIKETARNLENQKQRFKQEFIDLYVETRLPDLLNGIAAKIKQYLDCQEVSMFLYYSGKQELHFEVATGDKSQTLKTIILKKGTGIVGWVAKNLQSVITNNPADDPRFAVTPDKKSLFTTRSLAAVPVESDGQLIGVLEAVNHKSDNFTPGHISLLEYIAQLITIPLHNARLFHITQEEKEQKQQLVKLGSEIAASLEPQAILQTIKTFVTGIITPTTFIIANYTQKRAYDILNEKELPYEPAYISPISPSPRTFQTTLKANGKEIGFLKLQASIPIPPDAIPLLKGLANFTAIAINRHENLQELLEKQRYDKELELARDIQQRFLPKKTDTDNLKKIQVAYTNLPSTKVSGDYYDVIPLNDHETIITINDISGHGIPAAQFMSLYSATFNHKLKKSNDILETLKHLHDLFCQEPCNEHAVTSFTALINTAQRTIDYINCGHEYPVLFRNGNCIELSQGPTAIGYPKPEDFAMYTEPIESNDIIALFTDGITEAQNPKGHEYQSANLVSCIKQHHADPPQKILDACIDGLTRFTQKEKFNDDATLMIVKID